MINSLALRLLVGAVIWLAVTLGLARLGLAELFESQVHAQAVRQLGDQLNQLAAQLEWTSRHQLNLASPPPDPRYERPFSGHYWTVLSATPVPDGQDASARLPLQQSRSLWDQHLDLPTARSPDAGPAEIRLAGPEGQQLLAVERSLILPGADQPVQIAVALDHATIRAAAEQFERTLTASLIALAVGLLLMALGQIVFGLWPLRRLRRALAALRMQSGRELAGRWPSEVMPLVKELNALLARDAATLERSRRQAADLAHGLKTPLAVLGNEAGTAKGPLAEEVRRQAGAMHRQIERHLARARAVGRSGLGGALTDAGAALRELARALGRLHQDRGITLTVIGEARFAGDRQDLIEMCGNLMENACQWARSTVQIRLDDQPTRLLIEIEDDGRGMTEAEAEQVRAGFARIDETAPGSGLGLAISHEIASLYLGRLDFGRGRAGGLLVRLTLPRSKPD